MIKHMEHLDGTLVVHGGDHGRGWSRVILEETGVLLASAVSEDLGFVIFSVCTPRSAHALEPITHKMRPPPYHLVPSRMTVREFALGEEGEPSAVACGRSEMRRKNVRRRLPASGSIGCEP